VAPIGCDVEVCVAVNNVPRLENGSGVKCGCGGAVNASLGSRTRPHDSIGLRRHPVLNHDSKIAALVSFADTETWERSKLINFGATWS